MISQNFETSEHSFLRNIEQFLKSSCEKKHTDFELISFIAGLLFAWPFLRAVQSSFESLLISSWLFCIIEWVEWKSQGLCHRIFNHEKIIILNRLELCFESSTPDLPYDIVFEFNICMWPSMWYAAYHIQ